MAGPLFEPVDRTAVADGKRHFDERFQRLSRDI
jgi:hypothetical protein